MNPEKISEVIKKIRKDNNLTQKELADKLNVTFQAVSKWENAKGIPDIAILKQISKEYNISLDDLLDGEYNSKKSKKKYYLIGIIFIVLVILILLIINKKDNNFEFKSLSTTCDNFKISGTAAYSKDKTAISITNVTFCGDDKEKKYKKISCEFYEEYGNTKTRINTCKEEYDIDLVSYSENLNIKIDDYNAVCKSIVDSNLYLEISAYDENDVITSYKIPISIDDDCN